MEFLNNCCQPVELKELSLFLLMYADDMVIFSDTIKGLQDMLRGFMETQYLTSVT
jgi:hypothetical protein